MTRSDGPARSGAALTLAAPYEEQSDVVANLEDARDSDLIRRILAGDEEAFRALYRRYAPTAYGLARRIVKQEFLAEEVVQETFLSLWRGAAAYDARLGSVRGWLFSAIHHRAVDGVRREESQQRRAKRAGLRIERPQDESETAVHRMDLDGERARVRDALDALPPAQREVVTMMYFDALTQAQVADRLGLPLGTVKSRCLLGMRRLRASLAVGESS